MRKCIYLTEGECEEKLIKALKEKPTLIVPGKVKKFNVMQDELPVSLLMGLSQTALSKETNINRSILSRLETCDYSPSVDQLLSLSATLGFQPSDVIVDDEAEVPAVDRKKIAVAGTGYVGLSLRPACASSRCTALPGDRICSITAPRRNWWPGIPSRSSTTATCAGTSPTSMIS